MILIENNHICCLQHQTKMLRGRAQLFLTNPRNIVSKFHNIVINLSGFIDWTPSKVMNLNEQRAITPEDMVW